MNQKSLLAAVFVSALAFTSVACDDDSPSKTDARDTAGDRGPDTSTPGTDGGVDRTPDTGDAALDRTPDTGDASADRADTGADAADASADRTPDQAVDQAVDQAADLAADTTPDTTADTGVPQVVNGCTTFVDRTGAADDHSIDWVMTVGTDPERCMKVKAGTKVAWYGAFATHPISAFGGTTPNPIPALWNTGTGAGWDFNTPGVYGFHCTVHASMNGAIWVVP